MKSDMTNGMRYALPKDFDADGKWKTYDVGVFE